MIIIKSTFATGKLLSHVKSNTPPATPEVQQGHAFLHTGPGDVEVQHLLLGLGQGRRLVLR